MTINNIEEKYRNNDILTFICEKINIIISGVNEGRKQKAITSQSRSISIINTNVFLYLITIEAFLLDIVLTMPQTNNIFRILRYVINFPDISDEGIIQFSQNHSNNIKANYLRNINFSSQFTQHNIRQYFEQMTDYNPNNKVSQFLIENIKQYNIDPRSYSTMKDMQNEINKRRQKKILININE